MRKLFKLYPLVFLTLCCVTFVYNGESGWQIVWPGISGGCVVVGVIGVVLLYRIYRSLQQLWLEKGLSPWKLKTAYDKWVFLLAFMSLWGASWQGPMIEGRRPDEFVSKWTFTWGDANLSVPFALALIAVLFLYKILVLMNGLVGRQRD